MAQPFFSYAFRPFFLLGPVFAVFATVVWVLALYGQAPGVLPANITYWHAHEMLAGFALAAVAGFVLTAVASWTGRPPVSGGPLIVLLCAWLAGRLALFFSGTLTAPVVALLDMLFPLLLTVLVAREVLLAGNSRNYPVIGLVALLACCLLLYHLGRMGLLPMVVDAERVGLYLLLHLLLLLVTVIAGRIVPSFTANWLRARGGERLPVSRGALDRATIAVTAFTGLYATFLPASLVTAALAGVAAVLHALRLAGWCGLATWREPLLFVLHIAYAWFPVAYLLLAVSIAGWLMTPVQALHALALGVIGMMILAVMTRVALGHTGRSLHAGRLTVVTYVLAAVAVVLRLAGPAGSAYLPMMTLSAAAWSVAMILYLLSYAPILVGPRIDR